MTWEHLRRSGGAARLSGAVRRTATWGVVLLAVTYAPIGLTATWSMFVPGAPRLQEWLNGWVAGEDYATGPGSVHSVRAVDYADHRIVMLLHTAMGGLCLLLAIHQLVGPVRRHRLVGRVHLALVSVSMGAAVLFLLRSAAAPGAGQMAFRWQLWTLAVSTLATALLATFEVRRRNLAAHRAWMSLHVAFLLTAPALRLTWALLAPFLPGSDMLTHIEYGAVLLAVLAPGAGVLVALRPAALVDVGPSRGRYAGAGQVLGPVLVAAGGVLAVGVAGVLGPLDLRHAWFHIVPAAALTAWCAISVFRARDGEAALVADRVTMLRGAAMVSWSALVLGGVASAGAGEEAGLLVGLMVAPGLPLVVAMARVIDQQNAEPSRCPGRTANHLPRGDVALR